MATVGQRGRILRPARAMSDFRERDQTISLKDVKVPPNCGRREAKPLREAAHRFRFPALDDLQDYVSGR